jgi:iron(III) transport system permease protein
MTPASSRWRFTTAFVGLALAAVFAWPFLYLVRRGLADLGATWEALTSEFIAAPLWRTVQLTVVVVVVSTVVGVGLAWLTNRTDLPGRSFWRVTAALPLVLPSYVAATSLMFTVDRGGLLEETLGITSVPDLRGMPGAVIVMTVVSYPYVYLPVAARLTSLPPSLEETARMLGRSPWVAFRQIVLPQIAPSIAAGSLFVALYTVSDFGGVQIVGYDTLTRRLFDNLSRRPEVATAMGLLLAVLAITITVAERAVVRRTPPIPGIGSKRALLVPLRRWRWPSLVIVGAWTVVSLVAPVLVQIWMVQRGLANDAPRSVRTDLLGPALDSLRAGVIAGLVAVIVVVPIAVLTVRHRSRTAGLASGLVVSGFALPGLVTALAVVLAVRGTPLYLTFPTLIAAYVLHFGGQSLRSAQAAVGAVPTRLGEAARLLGAPAWRRFLRVELPLLVPGLAAGGGLVMLSVLKELPITIVLQPTGFNTLAQRTYNTFNEVLYVDSGLAALTLIAMSGALTWILVIRRIVHLRSR